MDKNYTIVAQVGTGGSAPPMDFHDFKLLNDGASALLVAFETVPYDLTAYGVTTGQGWVVQGAFQEVDVETGEVLFEWRSLDHVDPSVSYVRPNTTNVAGNGLSSMTGWNYLYERHSRARNSANILAVTLTPLTSLPTAAPT